MSEKEYFPCPVCKRMLIVKITKKNKPYCVCNICGMQLFVRGKEGIVQFTDLTKKIKIPEKSKDLINVENLFNSLNRKD